MVQATEEQQKAILCNDCDLTVAAGAGSGKTWVLTQKYMELLKSGLSPEDIVVITFTDKAAAEMKQRISGAVNNQLMAVESEGGIDQIIQWRKYRKGVETGVISTIHGFCSRLLKENPLAAWVDPEFSVLDEVKANLLLEEAISTAIEEDLAGDRVSGPMVQEVSILQLTEGIKGIYPKLLEQEVDLTQLLEQTMAVLQHREAQLELIIQELDEKVMDLIYLKDEVNKKTATYNKLINLMDKWPQWRELLIENARLRKTDDYFLNQVIKPLRNPISNAAAAVKEANAMVGEVLKKYENNFCSDKYINWIEAITHLLNRVHQLYEQNKFIDGQLDFMDLQLKTIHMLRNNGKVRKKYNEKFKVLMVDEFQDTNLAQKKLIELLLKGGNTRLMVVGDEKQSIYRFRGADVAVFRDVESEIDERGGEKASLSINFRTQAPIIQFINYCFAKIMDEAYQPLAANRNQGTEKQLAQLIINEYSADSSVSREHMLLNEATVLAQRIKEMTVKKEKLVLELDEKDKKEKYKEVRYGDITVLLSTMSNIHIYELALQREGIPFYILGSRGFFQRQEIIDLSNALKITLDRWDQGALLGVLRSPMFGISDETLFHLSYQGESVLHNFYNENLTELPISTEQLNKIEKARNLINDWQQEKTYLTLYKLLESILDQTEYLSILLAGFGGSQAYGNVQKLLQLSKKFDLDPTLSLWDFIKYLSEMKDRGKTESQAQVETENSNTVKLMTVHQSKGLEFPIVFIPDLGREFILDNDMFMYNKQLGLGVKLYSGEELGLGDGLYREIREIENKMTVEEEKRKLYVALTRARDYLVLMGSYRQTKKGHIPSLTDKKWLSWFQTIFKQQLTDKLSKIVDSDETWEVGVLYNPKFKQLEVDLSDHIMDVGGKDSIDLTEKPMLIGGLGSDGANQLPVLSVTALLDYYSCARKFYFSRLLQLPAAFHKPSNKQQTTNWSNTELGTFVHKVLQLLPCNASYEDLKQLLADTASASGYAEFPPETMQWTKNFIEDPLYSQLASVKEDYRELPFRLQLGDYYGVTGVIDRLVNTHQGTFLLDYKTNKIEQHNISKLIDYYTPQLKVYCLVAQNLLGWSNLKNYLVFLQYKPIEVSFSQEELREFQYKLTSTLKWLNEEKRIKEDFKQTTNREQCIVCTYNHLCFSHCQS